MRQKRLELLLGGDEEEALPSGQSFASMGREGIEPSRSFAPANLKSPRLESGVTTRCNRSDTRSLLHIVYVLSVLPLDRFESPGVGGASFPPQSPQDCESALITNGLASRYLWSLVLVSLVA